MVQRSGHSTCGYHGWSPWRTCFNVNFLRCNVANPRTTSPFPNKIVFNFLVLHGFRNLSRWERFGLFERDVSTSNSFHSSSGYGDGIFMLISWVFSLTRSCHFIIGVFLHARCIPHQNSQWLFWASVCVSVCVGHQCVHITWKFRFCDASSSP